MYSHTHAPENMYIVRPQYEYGMYKVTQSSQQSLPGYSCPAGHGVFTVITPPRTTTFNVVLQCRICYVVPHRAEACNSLPRMTKVSNEIGLYCIDHYYTACMFHAHFMHYTESDHQKLGGDQYIAGPPPTKKLGGLVSPGPHGCCAYAVNYIVQLWHIMSMRSNLIVC